MAITKTPAAEKFVMTVCTQADWERITKETTERLRADLAPIVQRLALEFGVDLKFDPSVRHNYSGSNVTVEAPKLKTPGIRSRWEMEIKLPNKEISRWKREYGWTGQIKFRLYNQVFYSSHYTQTAPRNYDAKHLEEIEQSLRSFITSWVQSDQSTRHAEGALPRLNKALKALPVPAGSKRTTRIENRGNGTSIGTITICDEFAAYTATTELDYLTETGAVAIRKVETLHHTLDNVLFTI